MKGLRMEHYDDVDDILLEALDILCGITSIRYGVEELEQEVEYVTGAINIVKLGDKPNTLKHRHHTSGKWSDDIEVSESYKNATYFNAEQIQNLISNHLTRKYYNNDFLELNNY